MNPFRPTLLYRSVRNGLMVMFSGQAMPVRNCMPEACIRPPGETTATFEITGEPADGVVGAAYSFVPTIDGGVGPYTFALGDCVLGADLAFDADTGAITSAELTTPDDYLCEITATDSLGAVSVLPIAFSITGGG